MAKGKSAETELRVLEVEQLCLQLYSTAEIASICRKLQHY